MINFRKAGLLILTLVIPALVFVFLKLFATNHYDLPHYHPQLSAAGTVQISGGDTVFYKVPDIILMDAGGKPYVEKFGDGRLIVAGFLPPSCDDSCRIVLAQVERVFALTESIPNLRFLTLSEEWKGNKDDYPSSLNTAGWRVLTGSDKEIQRTLFQVLKMDTKVPKAKTNSLESKLVLIDDKGHIRGYYNLSDLEETDRLMGEIKILDYEKKSN